MKVVFRKVFILCGICLVVMACNKRQEIPLSPVSSGDNSFDFRTDKEFNEMFAKPEFQQVASANERGEMSKIFEIYNMEDEEARKIAYNLLSPNEKYDFWDYLIDYKVSADKYSVNQKSLLLDLKNVVLQPSTFNDKTKQEIFRTQFLPLIAIQMNKAGISNEQLVKIFATGTLTEKVIM